MQLGLDGLTDSETSISYQDLTKSLVRRRQAWVSLERKAPLTHHTQHDCRSYELAGGMFADTNKDFLTIIRLPTSSNVKVRAFERLSIGFSARDFTMDPTQDLIVFLQDGGM